MRIAHVTPVYPPYRGGMGTVAQRYVRNVREEGNDVTVFVPKYRRAMPEDAASVLRPLFTFGNAAVIPSLLWRLRHFDVIHLHYPFYGGALFAAIAAWIWKKPLVVTYHMKAMTRDWRNGIFIWHRLLIEPIILRGAKSVLVSSFDYAQSIKLTHPELVELPFAFDAVDVAPAETEDVCRLLFVGGMDAAHNFKGVDILLRAGSRLQGDWQLDLVGDGDLRASYEELARSLGLEGHVAFLGRLSDAELSDAYARAHIHVLPSVNQSEAFGLVTLEAAAHATPSVVSDLPGVRTLVDPGVTGAIARPGDEQHLAEVLQGMMESNVQAMGHAAQQRVIENYSVTQETKRLIRIYNRSSLKGV